MRTVKTLKPGQKGTKEMQKRFGPSLLLVRYRYDEQRREHLKTVELVVQRRSREREVECVGSRVPAAGSSSARLPGSRSGVVAARSSRRVALRIGWREKDLQRRVKSAGGRWDPARRLWIVGRDVAERLDLLARVVVRGGGG